MRDQENIHPENNAQETTPGKVTEGRETRRESLMIVPETPSPDQPTDVNFEIKKELGHCHEIAGRKRHSRTIGINRNIDQPRGNNGCGFLLGNGDNGSRSEFRKLIVLLMVPVMELNLWVLKTSVLSSLGLQVTPLVIASSGILLPDQTQAPTLSERRFACLSTILNFTMIKIHILGFRSSIKFKILPKTIQA
ncbi:hypothetical protein POM88_041305 [Heracleum sosnowskyi]|uniref:Uncharacterized protein n=1 Tax=Heracleum sosnowskyi TaxID=360622 RepID=A0AAD8HG53_9APIA|nr:hypothetical protein POM88_041305 [Heracleum sosnowskyi]